MQNILSLLEIAKSSAVKAGTFLKRSFYSTQETLFNEGREIKLKIDHDSEEIILKSITSQSNLPILSEESGILGNLSNKFWVVDPLDGSSNYFRKIPICAVSVALIDQTKPVLGVIYDFMNDKLFYGAKNQGAFCNKQPISVSKTNEISMGTIMTGIPAKYEYSDEEFSNIIQLFQNWKKIRMIGSAAIANTYVANGCADYYQENDTFLWDIAAGAIIVEEAGGQAILSQVKSDFRVDAKFSNGVL